MSSVHPVTFLIFDGFQSLDLTGPFDVLAAANEVLDRRHAPGARYRLRIVSPNPTVRSEGGLQVVAGDASSLPKRIGTVIVPGGRGVQRAAATDGRAVALTEELCNRSDRVASICTGAFMLAAAGLLDGRRATTHWARADELRAAHPTVHVVEDHIGCVDGRYWSSAGVTAGIDLALSMVEHDHSVDVAQTVARWLVVFARRPEGQSQFAAPAWNDRATTSGVRRAQEAVETDPAGDHRVPNLARIAAMSDRHFTRRFVDEIGVTPAAYVQRVRAELARDLLERSDLGLEAIARQCGLRNAETLRRLFHRRFGTSPAVYRSRFTHDPSPILAPGDR